MIRISVVMPAFNAERSLPAALESVEAQTVAPHEIVVVDDCSTDETRSVLADWTDRFARRGIDMQVLALRRNAGPSKARNAGLEVARGTHIAFLDADDRWLPHRLEAIRAWLTSDDPALLAHRYADPTTPPAAACVAPARIRPLTIGQLLVRNRCQTSCVVLRANPALRFDPGMRYCEDHDLWLRALEHGTGRFVEGDVLTVLGRPQLTPGGLSGNIWRMRLGEMRVYRNFCMRRPLRRLWALPSLLAWSMVKHVLSAARRKPLAVTRRAGHGHVAG